MTPLSKAKTLLKSLNVENLSGSIIDASFTSSIQIFRNLVHLSVGDLCHDINGKGQCIFKLNNDNITELAMALSQLVYLRLGCPCFENTCATTVACFLPISVYCPMLRRLELHFNTTNIVDDLQNISEDPRFQGLRSLPRCRLSLLDVRLIPLTLDEPGFETVVVGMMDIFPSLQHCTWAGRGSHWAEISHRISKRRGTRKLP
jgi:hypothetical protein